MNPETPRAGPLIVGLGEALFDCFGERQVLGGAPLNFAVHAGQLLSGRGTASVATRVGEDDLGRQCIAELQRRGIDVRGCQVDPAAPTGRVDVTLDASGQPKYAIAADVAWDRLEWTPELERLAMTCDAVCYGTLAQRSGPSRSTIGRFVHAATNALRVCDLNLRAPHFDAVVVEESLAMANALKCNREELWLMCELLGVRPPTGQLDNDDRKLDERAGALAGRYGLKWVAVTRGDEGTVLFDEGERYDAAPDDELIAFASRPASDADSVGAGDACGAALVVGILRGLEPREIVRLANAVGAFVATRHGATPELPREIIAKFAE